MIPELFGQNEDGFYQFIQRRKKIRFKEVRPKILVIEPTNYCNLNCPFCMVGLHEELISLHGNASHCHISRPSGYMADETFDVIVKEAKSFGIKKIQLHFQGEPLLHKKFIAMTTRLKRERFEVQFFTNGLLLTEEMARNIVAAKVNMVRFSIDGTSQETYAQNRVGGKFEKAFHNLEMMAKTAKRKKTTVEWQFIVLSDNEHEIDSARKLAHKIGVDLVLKTIATTEKELIPKNKEYIRILKKKPCTDIYYQIGVYWNGDIVPCCYDTDGRNILGNINESCLKDIWNSGKYRDFRKQVDNVRGSGGNFEPSICHTCLRWTM